MYEDCLIYGPYMRSNGRKYIVLYKDGKTTSMSYPKYLVEIHLGRHLEKKETVDHFDRDKNNDQIENLVVRDRSDHAALDARRVLAKTAICVYCGKEFVIEGKRVKDRRPRYAGPFCSKNCVGKYGAERRFRKINCLENTPVNKEYFQLEKSK